MGALENRNLVTFSNWVAALDMDECRCRWSWEWFMAAALERLGIASGEGCIGVCVQFYQILSKMFAVFFVAFALGSVVSGFVESDIL